MQNKKVTFSINFPIELLEKLKQKAKEEDRSVSNLVVYIVNQYLGD